MSLPSSTTNTADPSLWSLVGPATTAIGAAAGANTAAGGYKAAAGGSAAAGAASGAALSPYAGGGTAAENALLNMYGLGSTAPNYAAFENQPGYKFQVDQGDQAIKRGAAAAGGGFSASTLGALSGYNEGLASTTYQNYLNTLYQLTSTGSAAAANYGGQQITAAGDAGKFRTGASTATASGINGVAGATNLLVNAAGKLFGSNSNNLGLSNDQLGIGSGDLQYDPNSLLLTNSDLGIGSGDLSYIDPSIYDI